MTQATDEDALDKIVRDQDINLEEMSPEERRQLEGDLDHQNREEIPRPSEDGDWDADLDEKEVVHDDHDNR